MSISIHNYEEYFLLYIDNELTAGERKAVEEFIAEHPHLAPEFSMIKQTLLRPDKNIVFNNKESLLKDTSANTFINESNYEELFILYADDELTNDQKELVEQFIYSHPQYQEEFELIHQVKLEPDHSIVFPAKEELYRKDKDHKVVPFRWWRVAAAAIILFFIGGLAWMVYNVQHQGDGKTPDLVKSTTIENKRAPEQQPEKNQIVEEKPIAVNQDKIPALTKNSINISSSEVSRKQVNKQLMTNRENIVVKNQYESNIRIPDIVTPKDIAKLDEPKSDRLLLTKPATTIEYQQPVVDEAVGAEELTTDSDNDVIQVANISVSKKNKLRGIFRKASRLIEKVTNFSPAENGIRVANFEIAVK